MKPFFLLVALLCCLVFPLACTSPDTPPNEAAAAVEPPAAPANPAVPADDTTTQQSLGAAPDFTLTTLDGQVLKLSDLRGDVVLLNFWATWCAPCVEEIPELIKLHEELSPYGFHVVGVSLDEEGAEAVAPFAERFGISYPLAVDDYTVADSFGGIFVLPTTYVIDGDGRIMQRVIGLFPVEQMRPALRALVDAPPVKTISHVE